MNKWINLELLKETLKKVLCSDELDDTFYYLDEYKRLKILEEKGVLKCNIKQNV